MFNIIFNSPGRSMCLTIVTFFITLTPTQQVPFKGLKLQLRSLLHTYCTWFLTLQQGAYYLFWAPLSFTFTLVFQDPFKRLQQSLESRSPTPSPWFFTLSQGPCIFLNYAFFRFHFHTYSAWQIIFFWLIKDFGLDCEINFYLCGR